MRRQRHDASRLLAVLSLLLLAGGAQAGPAWRVSTGDVKVVCPLTVGGRFEAKTTRVSGELAVAEAGSGALGGALRVELGDLETGIELRNRHLRENYLEVQKGEGFDAAVLSGLKLAAADPATFRGKTTFEGKLTLHGTEQAVSGSVELSDAGAGLAVEASFPLTISNYAIEKPRHLGVGVKDEIMVHVSLTLVGAGDAS